MDITGYASPIPEKGITDLFAYLSVTQNNTLLSIKKITPENMTAFDAQVNFANQALEEFVTLLRK